MEKKERTKCEIWSRVVGYLRPTNQYNPGKQQEFKERKVFKIKEDEDEDGEKKGQDKE